MEKIALLCDICGGSLAMHEGGEYAVCEMCGMKYYTGRLREKVQEIRGSVVVEGSVNVEGLANFNNLVWRGNDLYNEGEWKDALIYYNRPPDTIRGLRRPSGPCRLHVRLSLRQVRPGFGHWWSILLCHSHPRLHTWWHPSQRSYSRRKFPAALS